MSSPAALEPPMMDGALEPVLSAAAAFALARSREREFEKVIMRLGDRLFRLAHAWLESPDEVDDLVQKVMSGLWDSDIIERTGGNEARIWPYLRQSMSNALTDHFRENGRHRKGLARYAAAVTRLKRYFTPYDHSIAAEMDRHVCRLLKELPPGCRQVLEMVRRDGMKYEDIAEELHVSVSTVKTHAAKALRHLRKGLKAVGYYYEASPQRDQVEDTP